MRSLSRSLTESAVDSRKMTFGLMVSFVVPFFIGWFPSVGLRGLLSACRFHRDIGSTCTQCRGIVDNAVQSSSPCLLCCRARKATWVFCVRHILGLAMLG